MSPSCAARPRCPGSPDAVPGGGPGRPGCRARLGVRRPPSWRPSCARRPGASRCRPRSSPAGRASARGRPAHAARSRRGPSCSGAASGHGPNSYWHCPVADGETLYDRAGGQPWFDALVERFYEGVEDDPVLRPLYPEDLGPGKRGWPCSWPSTGAGRTYSEEKGHPRLRARHLPFAIDTPERDAWVRHMTAAIRPAGCPRGRGRLPRLRRERRHPHDQPAPPGAAPVLTPSAGAAMMAAMTYRVIQWATGGVGRAAIEGVLDHPELELVGLLGPQRGQGRQGRRRAARPGPGRRHGHDRRRRAPGPRRRRRPLLAGDGRPARSSTASCARARTWSRRSAGSTRPRTTGPAMDEACRRGRRHPARHRHPPGRHHRALPADGLGPVPHITHVRAEEFSDIRTYGGARRRPPRDAVRRHARGGGRQHHAGRPRRRVHPVRAHGRRRAGLPPRRRADHQPRGGRGHRPDRLAHRPHRAGPRRRPALPLVGHGRRRAGGHRRGELVHGPGGPRPGLDLRPRGRALRGRRSPATRPCT